MKTGQISEITSRAFDLLKKGGHLKDIDVIDEPKVNVVNAQTNAPKIETTTTVIESIPEPIQEEEFGTSREELIEKIKAAQTVEEVDQLIEGEKRQTVIKAAQKRKGEMKIEAQ